MKAQRLVWGETVLELSLGDDRLVVIDADLATSTMANLVAEGNPRAFVQAGIAEQNAVGMAFGMSTLGYRPWVSSFGVFLTHRALDQVRMLLAQTGAPVRIAASYAGLLNGASGKTHQDIEDLAIMRAMPGMVVLAPADEHEARAVTRWASQHDGPVYVRLARDAVAPVFDPDCSFSLGEVRTVREGDDLVLISTGVQTSRTLAAAELLAASEVEARVVHLPTIKPLDTNGLLAAVGTPPLAITVEEHTRIGGLGSLVSEVFTEHRIGTPLAKIGLADTWSESAPNDFLLDRYGLSPRRVAEQVLAELA